MTLFSWGGLGCEYFVSRKEEAGGLKAKRLKIRTWFENYFLLYSEQRWKNSKIAPNWEKVINKSVKKRNLILRPKMGKIGTWPCWSILLWTDASKRLLKKIPVDTKLIRLQKTMT